MPERLINVYVPADDSLRYLRHMYTVSYTVVNDNDDKNVVKESETFSLTITVTVNIINM